MPEDQPQCHTITGDSTIPAEGSVETRNTSDTTYTDGSSGNRSDGNQDSCDTDHRYNVAHLRRAVSDPGDYGYRVSNPPEASANRSGSDGQGDIDDASVDGPDKSSPENRNDVRLMTDGGEPNCHTITGDGTIPEDATVQTRDSPVEVTLQTDIDESPHHCGGCDRDFRTIDRLLNHACAENFGAPSPDESGDDRIPMTDGGQPGGAMASSAMDGADGEEKRLEDLEPTISPEQIRAEMSETRRIILQTLVDLDAERDTVRYRTILSRIEDEHDLRLAAETLLEHFTFIVLYDLAERSYTARLNTIVEPTEAALDVLDDNGGESR